MQRQFHQPVTPYPTGNSGKPLQCTPKDTKRSPAVLGAFQDGKQTRYIDVMFTRRRGNGKLNRLHMYGCVPLGRSELYRQEDLYH